MSKHIFLSYSRADAEITQQIRQALETEGYVVWQDQTAIKGGDEWINSISEGVKNAFVVVSVVSQAAIESRWVRLEFLEAQRREKPIIPIKIDACEIPMMMLDLNVLHGHPDLQKGIHNLINTIPASDDTDAHPANQRDLELDYLNKLLLEHGVWQEIYTPMSGVGQISIAESSNALAAGNAEIDNLFEAIFMENSQHATKTERQEYADILVAIREMQHLVILGDPGAGKTTTLWKIAADAAVTAKDDPAAPLPVMVRLGNLPAETRVRNQIQKQLGEIPLDDLLREKRIILLLDGLNELRKERRDEKVAELKTLIQQAQANNLLAAVTCRELDYVGNIDIGIPQCINIKPLDPLRIRDFVNAYFEGDKGHELFWALAGRDTDERRRTAHAYWLDFTEKKIGDEQTFWLAKSLPEGKEWGYDNWGWKRWLALRDHARSLMKLATNPYMLYMMVKVFQTYHQIPENRGDLFGKFILLLGRRERIDQEKLDKLTSKLAMMAYAMQQREEGTGISKQRTIEAFMYEDELYLAQSANILIGTDEIRFSHQLLQEYFAALNLDNARQARTLAGAFWINENWWKPTVWDESAILLAGLYSNDCSEIIVWLRQTQPELAARCILESGAALPDDAYEKLGLREAWLPRLTDLNSDPMPEARAAVGRALGLLDYDTYTHQRQRPILDNRKGVSVVNLPSRSEVNIPDIDWVEIPDQGEWIYQDEKHPPLSTFYLSRYPITYAQFQCFVDAPDVFDKRWWVGMPEEEEAFGVVYHIKEFGDQYFKYANHPRELVSWYQAMAFCRWLSDKLGFEVNLPTEYQWERAARGTDGREYPWGKDYQAGYANINERGQHYLQRTSAVGIYPQGASSENVLDMSGNVFEWCLNKYYEPTQVTEDASGSSRVLRGGSWYDSNSYSRATYRPDLSPSYRHNRYGFRVVCATPDSSDFGGDW